MVLGIALCDVLDQGAVVRQEVRRDVDGFRVPDLAVLEAVLLWVQSGQEPQLCADAEVRDDHVQCLVEQLVFGHLCCEVLSQGLLSGHSLGVRGLASGQDFARSELLTSSKAR